MSGLFAPRSRLGAFILCASACAFVAGALRPSGPADWSLAKWVEWRDGQIERILEPGDGGAVARAQVALRCDEAYRTIEPVLNNRTSLLAEPGAQKELGNFFSFVQAQRLFALPGHKLAMKVSDRDYMAYAAQRVRLPALLTSQTFLEAMSQPDGYLNALHMIDRYNGSLPEGRKWTVALFHGRFIKSVDRKTYGRMLVVVPNAPVPGGVRDTWVSFAIATPDLQPVPQMQSVSVVSVERRDGTPGNRAAMVDFLRTRRASDGAIELMPTPLLDDNPSKNCYDCHKTAVLPIHPAAEYGFDAKGGLVEKAQGSFPATDGLNALIRGYGKSDFGPQESTAYGPCLGPPDRARGDAEIQRMAGGGLSPESVLRIKAAMKCASCHASFAPLNYPEALRTDRDEQSMLKKMGPAQVFVEEGRMPPGNTLTPEERRALWRCLTLEYFDPSTKTGLLTDWLKGR